MKPSQLTTFLASAIAAKAPILITGAPGIGKSALVEQAAREAGADMILSHPAVADPTDAKGLPWANPDSESATFLPFGELAQALKAERPTVWFLDDLGQAPPAVQARSALLRRSSCNPSAHTLANPFPVGTLHRALNIHYR